MLWMPMSSPQMTRMFGFFSEACMSAGAHKAATHAKTRTLVSVRLIVCLSPLNHHEYRARAEVHQASSRLKCKHALPVVLHADDHPALLLRLVVEPLRKRT